MEFIDLKRSLRLKEWKDQVEDCLHSNLSTHAWCQANGISKSGFYYRQHKVAMEYGKLSQFVSVDEERPESTEKPEESVYTEKITIHYPHVVIEIPQGADPETIREILHMVQAPC